jgi:transcriptional regulator with XRE-family HTH domain
MGTRKAVTATPPALLRPVNQNLPCARQTAQAPHRPDPSGLGKTPPPRELGALSATTARESRKSSHIASQDAAWTLCALGNRIAEERGKLGLSLRALEKLSGVSNARISQIENGGNASITTLYRIAWALGLHPSLLLPQFLRAPSLDLDRAAAAAGYRSPADRQMAKEARR